MNKLIIIGSARMGNSHYIGNCIVEAYEGGDIELIRLSDYKINYCTGCLECDETHKCCINDDMEVLLNKVKSTDLITLISPVRYSLLSGDLKVFIDRLNPTAVSNEIVGKRLIAIVVGQSEEGTEDHSVEKALQSIVDFAENAGLDVLGRYAIFNCYDANDASKQEGIETLCQEIAAKMQ